MESTIFGTRRYAELAVNTSSSGAACRKVTRSVLPAGGANTAGKQPAGADAKVTPEPGRHQSLPGSLEVSVDGDDPERIADALTGAGAKAVRTE